MYVDRCKNKDGENIDKEEFLIHGAVILFRSKLVDDFSSV